MSPQELKKTRVEAGLTQTQAAEMVGITLRNWQHWEAGTRKINAGLIELFMIKFQIFKLQ